MNRRVISRPGDINAHRRSCKVCRSTSKTDIEKAFKAQVPIATISEEFDVPKTSIKTHARAFPRLQHSRAKNLLGVLDLAIEAAVSQIPKMEFKPQHIADLVLKRAQVAGTLVHLSADVTKRYAGRTDDDLLYRSQHGEWPEESPEPDSDKTDIMPEPAQVQ